MMVVIRQPNQTGQSFKGNKTLTVDIRFSQNKPHTALLLFIRIIIKICWSLIPKDIPPSPQNVSQLRERSWTITWATMRFRMTLITGCYWQRT